MYIENISKYISTGSVFGKDKSAYRKHCIGPALLTVIVGVVPGIVLGGYHLFMTIAMSIISLTCVFAVYIISSKELTLKKVLYLDAIISGTWVFDLSIVELMYFMIWKGFNPWFLFIYLPVILIPFLANIKINKLLKSENYNPKKIAHSNIRTVSFLYGILGMNFAAIFRNVDQSILYIIVLLILCLFNSFISLGLLSLKKIYYIDKYNL